jgi:ABC-type xylose transport system permease subunit
LAESSINFNWCLVPLLPWLHYNNLLCGCVYSARRLPRIRLNYENGFYSPSIWRSIIGSSAFHKLILCLLIIWDANASDSENYTYSSNPSARWNVIVSAYIMDTINLGSLFLLLHKRGIYIVLLILENIHKILCH